MKFGWMKGNNWYSTTPITGFIFINDAESKKLKCFWYIVLIAFLSLTINNILEIVKSYLENPIMTKVDITSDPIKVPELLFKFTVSSLEFRNLWPWETFVYDPEDSDLLTTNHFNGFVRGYVDYYVSHENKTRHKNRTLPKDFIQTWLLMNISQSIEHSRLQYGYEYSYYNDDHDEDSRMERLANAEFEFDKFNDRTPIDMVEYSGTRQLLYTILLYFYQMQSSEIIGESNIGELNDKDSGLNYHINVSEKLNAFNAVIEILNLSSTQLISKLTEDLIDMFEVQVFGNCCGVVKNDKVMLSQIEILHDESFMGQMRFTFYPNHSIVNCESIEIHANVGWYRELTGYPHPNKHKILSAFGEFHQKTTALEVILENAEHILIEAMTASQITLIPTARVKSEIKEKLVIRQFMAKIDIFRCSQQSIEERCFEKCKYNIYDRTCGCIPIELHWLKLDDFDKYFCGIFECSKNETVRNGIMKCYTDCKEKREHLCDRSFWRINRETVKQGSNGKSIATVTISTIKGVSYPQFNQLYAKPLRVFLAELGGTMDLWVGISVIGVLHAVVYFITHIYSIITRNTEREPVLPILNSKACETVDPISLPSRAVSPNNEMELVWTRFQSLEKEIEQLKSSMS